MFFVFGKDGLDVSSLQEQRAVFLQGIIKRDNSSGSLSFHCVDIFRHSSYSRADISALLSGFCCHTRDDAKEFLFLLLEG